MTLEEDIRRLSKFASAYFDAERKEMSEAQWKELKAQPTQLWAKFDLAENERVELVTVHVGLELVHLHQIQWLSVINLFDVPTYYRWCHNKCAAHGHRLCYKECTLYTAPLARALQQFA